LINWAKEDLQASLGNPHVLCRFYAGGWGEHLLEDMEYNNISPMLCLRNVRTNISTVTNISEITNIIMYDNRLDVTMGLKSNGVGRFVMAGEFIEVRTTTRIFAVAGTYKGCFYETTGQLRGCVHVLVNFDDKFYAIPSNEITTVTWPFPAVP
jgi:hypothetical protein